MCVTSDMYVSHKLTFLCQGQISRSSTTLTQANRLLLSWNSLISQHIFEIKNIKLSSRFPETKVMFSNCLFNPTVQNPETPLHVQRPEWCSWWSSLENKPSTLSQTPAELNQTDTWSVSPCHWCTYQMTVGTSGTQNIGCRPGDVSNGIIRCCRENKTGGQKLLFLL